MNMADWKRRHRDFILALEEERRKIQMFSRELPLCLQLVNEAIDSLWRIVSRDEGYGERPALEKGASNCKPDWLRSVQLWSPVADGEHPAEGGTLRKPIAVNATRVGRAFQPFQRNELIPAAPEAPAVSSTMEGVVDGSGKIEKKEEEGQSLAPALSNRKHRRCWSSDLHRKFLNALEQIGGSHAATPKQIRELMKVDGLTNDEVKSHLQKYRLHTRRPVAVVQSSSSNSTKAPPQFVLLGSIWVPPQEYTATAEAATATAQVVEGSSAALNVIYSPKEASPPLDIGLLEEQQNKKQQTNRSPVTLHSQRTCSQDGKSLVQNAATTSNSSSTSFLSQTTTVSPSL